MQDNVFDHDTKYIKIFNFRYVESCEILANAGDD